MDRKEIGSARGHAAESRLPGSRKAHKGPKGRAARKRSNPYLYENLLHNLEGQIERWRARAIQAESFEEQRHWASKAQGVEYAVRLLNAFRPDFEPGRGEA